MNDKNIIIQVNYIVGGGAHDYGETVVAQVKTDQGNIELQIPYSLLPKFVDSLHQFGQMALDDRRKRPGDTGIQEVIQPYQASGKPRIGRDARGSVAIQFPTAEGVPVTIAMSQDIARNLGHSLLQQTEASPPTGRKH